MPATSFQQLKDFLFFLVLMHDVLKWLHHPLLKNTMLLHPTSAWHNILHSSTLDTFPGELFRYTSPAFVSQTTFLPTCTHLRGVRAVVCISTSELNRSDIAFRFDLVLVHAVLKWLHHPLAPKYVMLRHPGASAHESLHCARLEPFPGESLRYTSPALVSHSALAPSNSHTRCTAVRAMHILYRFQANKHVRTWRYS